MRKLCIVLTLSLLLCACTKPEPTDSGKTQATDKETTVQTQVQTQITEVPEPTEAPHSPLYLSDYTEDQILKYFQEVALNMEYTTGSGDATLIQKWKAPIQYQIFGTPTEEDIAVLEALFEQLNAIPGFPGIYEAGVGEPANLSISFLAPDPFRLAFSQVVNGEDAYGATQFWYYTATNEIHTARIGYRTDLDQTTRNSILLEEIVNTLGISDTVLREDSIVYQYSNTNLALSDVDWVILKLLYDPAIQCGMNAADCTELIRSLYY